MDAGAAFSRLVLGDREAEIDGSAPAVAPAEAVAAAWRRCAPELARRRSSFGWDENPDEAQRSPLLTALAALDDLERAALAAEAVGLDPTAIARALDVPGGEAEALLARGHAELGGLGRPADARCAAERARLAAARGRARTAHRDDCRAFAAALPGQRRALRGEAGRRRVEPADARALALRTLEPEGPRARLVVALAVLVLAGLGGFGVVSAVENASKGGGSDVITATPVGPLPPGVGPASP